MSLYVGFILYLL